MPSGDRPRRTAIQLGYSYLAVLFLVAITAAALASIGQYWSTAIQRERERELEFRGLAIASAIDSYVRANRPGSAELPLSWEDLLEDRRGPVVQRHLRKKYPDPFTGIPDWELLHPPGGKGFYGVRSTSPQVLMQELPGKGIGKACDRIFEAHINSLQDPMALPRQRTASC